MFLLIYFSLLLFLLQVPLINLLVSGFCSGLIALFFDLEKLVEFMSIGTLLAYTIVSASVIILRYRPELTPIIREDSTLSDAATPSSGVRVLYIYRKIKYK